jgi:hypothetical protein
MWVEMQIEWLRFIVGSQVVGGVLVLQSNRAILLTFLRALQLYQTISFLQHF